MPDQAPSTLIPPAFQLLKASPVLYSQVAAALETQQTLIQSLLHDAIPRSDIITQIQAQLQTMHTGVLTINAQPGSGLTTLLCQLALSVPYALWLPACSGTDGYEALCAQVIAMRRHPLALLPPAARRDAAALERLLAEPSEVDQPLVLIIDTRSDVLVDPLPMPFPAVLPEGVVIVAGCIANEQLPLSVDYSITPGADRSALLEQMLQFINNQGYDSDMAHKIIAASQDSWLYVRLVCDLLYAPDWSVDRLPNGLEALHHTWLEACDEQERWIVELLAAAEHAVDAQKLATLANMHADTLLEHARKLAPFVVQEKAGLRLLHHATRLAILQDCGSLEQAHTAFASFAVYAHEHGHKSQSPVGFEYTTRHIALSEQATRLAFGELPESRAWIMSQERHSGSMRSAAHAQQWSLCAAALDGPVLRLLRSAALGGTLTSRARSLPREAATVLQQAMAAGAQREPVMSRLRNLLEQLPDGREKSGILRLLGETCYSLGMRAPAMRMLSEALDLEAQGQPRSWRDEREELLVALSRAAIAHGWNNTALGITTLITHAERRGLIDTEVVRALLDANQLTRAEEVAYAIGHPNAHDWAMAEVAVGHARTGDIERALVIQETLHAPTTVAWVTTELASDAAQRGDPDAISTVLNIRQPMLRDRALARVARSLAEQSLLIEAFAATTHMSNPELRVRSLIMIASLDLEAAPVALAGAIRLLSQIEESTRSSVIANLAAAYASISRIEHARELLEQLPEGEERDRAQSRMASTLMQRGMMSEALGIARAINDPDERSWAIDELARLMATRTIWPAAFELAAEIEDTGQRERTEGDLVIAWARGGYPQEALERAMALQSPAERLRTLIAISSPLAASPASEAIQKPIPLLSHPDQRSRYQAAGSAALASQGYYEAAEAMAMSIVRPLERARALAALAHALALGEQDMQAQSVLGLALREAAWLGRSETFSCLAWSAETLALLGGGDLLLSAASVLDELDSWWTGG